MKRLNRLGWVVVAVTVSAAAVAQVAIKPAKSAAEAKTAIESRQALFKDIKKNYEPMIDMMKNKVPFDAAVIGANAQKIQDLAAKIPEAFAIDTHEFKDTKNEAQDRVWLSQVEFKAKSDATVQAAAALVAAAKTGDKGATMKAIPAMGKTCGSCHDIFKFKE
ncbi:MAG: cytochrome c [Steroidobacteraceae bacterium]